MTQTNTESKIRMQNYHNPVLGCRNRLVMFVAFSVLACIQSNAGQSSASIQDVVAGAARHRRLSPFNGAI